MPLLLAALTVSAGCLARMALPQPSISATVPSSISALHADLLALTWWGSIAAGAATIALGGLAFYCASHSLARLALVAAAACGGLASCDVLLATTGKVGLIVLAVCYAAVAIVLVAPLIKRFWCAARLALGGDDV